MKQTHGPDGKEDQDTRKPAKQARNLSPPKYSGSEPPMAKSPSERSPTTVFSIHLNHQRILVEYGQAVDDERADCDIQVTLNNANKVTDGEVLDAIKKADKSDPDVRELLRAVANESGFQSIREAAKEALEQNQ